MDATVLSVGAGVAEGRVNAKPGVCSPPAMTSGSGNNAPTVTGSTPQNGESKPPQAIVKPQILTHVIEGFVIQEGAEPFPVSSWQLPSHLPLLELQLEVKWTPVKPEASQWVQSTHSLIEEIIVCLLYYLDVSKLKGYILPPSGHVHPIFTVLSRAPMFWVPSFFRPGDLNKMSSLDIM